MATFPAPAAGRFTITFDRAGVVDLVIPDDYTLADLPMLAAVKAAIESAAKTYRVLIQ